MENHSLVRLLSLFAVKFFLFHFYRQKIKVVLECWLSHNISTDIAVREGVVKVKPVIHFFLAFFVFLALECKMILISREVTPVTTFLHLP